MFLDTLIKNLNRSIHRFPEVRRYLHSRYVTDEDIVKYEIGYNKIVTIPEDPGMDRQKMMDECYKGRKLEGKIIFPIKDNNGKVEGLIGRSAITKEFKIYVTESYKFNGFFFGLPQALPYAYKENKVYVVEGQFDYFALVRVFPNTVALLTSRLSEAQYEYLTLYCDNIVTVFDSDKGGVEGAEKSREFEGVTSIDLKNYKDPAACLEILKPNRFSKFILKQSSNNSIKLL